MNMIKLENKILCSNFVMLGDIEKEDKIFISGPIVLELENDSDRIVQYYSRYVQIVR